MELYRIYAKENYGNEQVLVYAESEDRAFEIAENYIPPREYAHIEKIEPKEGLVMTGEVSPFGSHIDFYAQEVKL